MYLKEELLKLGDKKIRLYLDMDGTIVHYDVGKADDYHTKRPLIDRINKIKRNLVTEPNDNPINILLSLHLFSN